MHTQTHTHKKFPTFNMSCDLHYLLSWTSFFLSDFYFFFVYMCAITLHSTIFISFLAHLILNQAVTTPDLSTNSYKFNGAFFYITFGKICLPKQN